MLLNECLKEHHKVEGQARKAQEQEATIAHQDRRIQEKEMTIAEMRKEMESFTARLDEQASQTRKASAQLAAASPSRGGLEGSSPLRTPQMVATNP